LKTPWIRNEFANGSKKYKQGALFVADISGGQTMSIGGGGDGGPDTTQQNSTTANAGSPPSQENQPEANTQQEGGKSDTICGGTSDLSYLGDNITLYSADGGANANNFTGNSTVSATNNAGGGMSFSSDIDFVTAVNGPTNSSNALGVKEWLSLRSNNTLSFFNQ
jgi:hypothetical protein